MRKVMTTDWSASSETIKTTQKGEERMVFGSVAVEWCEKFVEAHAAPRDSASRLNLSFHRLEKLLFSPIKLPKIKLVTCSLAPRLNCVCRNGIVWGPTTGQCLLSSVLIILFVLRRCCCCALTAMPALIWIHMTRSMLMSAEGLRASRRSAVYPIRLLIASCSKFNDYDSSMPFLASSSRIVVINVMTNFDSGRLHPSLLLINSLLESSFNGPEVVADCKLDFYRLVGDVATAQVHCARFN